ncbi:MAG: hypothetical protein U0457_09670 [Candidatus Sericytochromatia bacterium]
MPISWIEYKNKKIVYSDYRNQKGEEAIKTLYEERDFFLKLKDGDKVLVLSDFRGAYGSNEFMEISKKLGKEVFAPKTIKSAILGIEGVKKVLLKAYVFFTGENLKPFDSEELAKEWLIE